MLLRLASQTGFLLGSPCLIPPSLVPLSLLTPLRVQKESPEKKTTLEEDTDIRAKRKSFI